MPNMYVPRPIYDLIQDQHSDLLDLKDDSEHVAEWEAMVTLLDESAKDRIRSNLTTQFA